MPQARADPWARWTAVMDEPLVLATIDHAHETWLSAEAITAETRLPIDRVQYVLDHASANVIVAPVADARGQALYSTREHYRRTTSVLTRYLDALVSS